MSLPIVRLNVGNLKEGVTTAHSTFKKLRDAYAVGGLANQSFGVAIEDPRKLFWIIYHETNTPKDFLSKWSSEVCDYSKAIGEIMTEEPDVYDMPSDSCSKPFPKALTDAPVTEIGIARPKKAEYLEQYKKLQQNVVDTQGAELGAHDGWLSVTKDEKGAWTGMIFVGWESLEAHTVAQAKNGGLLPPLHEIAGLVSMSHVSLTYHV